MADPDQPAYDKLMTGVERREAKGLDPIGWFIANSHAMLGHDKTAYLISQPPGDKTRCVLCLYEADPTPERKQAVIDAIGVVAAR